MIEVTDLTKSYGPVHALDGVSFRITPGEIVGLLGPNGAGKTTILKILTGYLQQDSGAVKISGMDVLTNTQAVQALIGYLPENAPLYPELNVQSYLQMIASLRTIPEEMQLAAISEAVHAVGLEDYLTRPIGELSKGFRQRVGLAQAILHKPALLILDEPTVGLDPTQIVEIRGLIKRMARTSTILFSSHILPEVEALCDRAIILINGKIKADSDLEVLARTSSAILVLEKSSEDAIQALKELPGVVRVEPEVANSKYPAYRIQTETGVDIQAKVFQLAVQKGWLVREIRQDVERLETVFNELVMAA